MTLQHAEASERSVRLMQEIGLAIQRFILTSPDASHGWARKVAVGPRGTLYGVCGNAPEATAFLEWVWAGERGEMPKPEALPDGGNAFIVLTVEPGGAITVITARGNEVYPDAPYYALGAGSQAAFGALHAGASAEGAIKAAKAHASDTFGKIQTVSHP